jgi:molybdopterin synthase catalytic subunit
VKQESPGWGLRKNRSVTVRVLFFGPVKDLLGSREQTVDLPAGSTLGALFDHYTNRVPRLKELADSIVLARNQEFAEPGVLLADGDEVAFLPPVSGGLGNYTQVIEDDTGNFFALTRVTIDAAEVARQILRGEDGAFVNFEGVVRNNTKGRATKFLDYECYEAMAVKMMAEIGRDIAKNHAIGRIAIIHRLGRMEIGETSVAVIATAPHRKPAFEAALEGINRLKKTVPIWKKEYFVDGEVWVDGEWDDDLARAGSAQS